jgi:ubiquinone/menaquinone biosynthesis C-methylase UbiE
MRFTLLSLTLVLACKTAPPRAQHFENAQDWAAKFEDPSRDVWQKPDDVISALALSRNAVVADLGSATGYFSVRLSKAVPQGNVFGLDVESSMVDYLNTRADNESLKNVTSILASFDDPKIPEPVDLVLVVDTFHHIDARQVYFSKLKLSLKPLGRVAIIDFTEASKMGPPLAYKLSAAQVTQELEQAGFRLAQHFDWLPEQYFLIFEKA